MVPACDGDAGCQPPPTGSGYTSAGLSIPGITPAMCANVTSYADTDLDRMNDVCEEALASAFAPKMLQVDWTDFSYDVPNGRMGGEYFHATYPLVCGTAPCKSYARIAYLPAYYRDLGAMNTAFNGFDSGHPGDSEFIIVDIAYDAAWGNWQTNGVFLSAHCGAQLFDMPISVNPYCKWYGYSEMEYVNGIDRGAPVVYVANGTNANYRSLGECDGGTNQLDTCRANRAVRFPVSFDFNIGSAYIPMPSVAARRSTTLTNPNRREFMWAQEAPFGGWQDDAGNADATPYGKILYTFASPGYTGGGIGGCTNGITGYRGVSSPTLMATTQRTASPPAPTGRGGATRLAVPTGSRRAVAYDPCS
jgi:hypothetical protein